MPVLKSGPLTRAELQQVWEGSVDAGYRDPLVAAGDGRGFEVWTQFFAQLERASSSIDATTQSLFISPWSGQTSPPAGGASRSTVVLTFTRAARLQEPLLLGQGMIWVAEETTDWDDGGPQTVLTGRRYSLAADLYFPPGVAGPLTVVAEAQVPGKGYDNPLPRTLVSVEQPGSGFNNDLATVIVSPAPGTVPSGSRTTAFLVADNQPDMFVPEHVGQRLLFVAGSNAGRAVRIAGFGSPALPAGSSVEIELLYAVTATTYAGTFLAGENVAIAGGSSYGRVVAETISGGFKHLAIVLLTGTDAGITTPADALLGLTSGATATIKTIEYSSGLVSETATASWKILDWVADYGLAVTNVASPAGGRVAMLDEIGDERGVNRSSGESDDGYRARVREIADVVTPNAIRRAMNRSFAGHAWTLREAGSAGLPGFFFDGGNEPPSTTPGREECDPYDPDVIVASGTVTGTFDFQEDCVFEEVGTLALIATGRATVTGSSLVLARRDSRVPATPFGPGAARFRGLHSGAIMVPSVAQGFQSQNRYWRSWLDYAEFRGFFDMEVEKLGLGEFGFAYDVTGAYPYDGSAGAFDGFPAGDAAIYRRVRTSLDAARAGGVGDELVLPPDPSGTANAFYVQFSPSSLGPTGWWRTIFGGVPWLPNGTTTGNLVTSGVAPSVGTAIAGLLTPAQFNGTTQGLKTGTAIPTDLYGGFASNFDPMTVVVFFRDTSPVAAGGAAFYDLPGLATDSGSHWGLISTASGVRAGAWGGGTDETAFIALAASTWAMAAFRFDGTNIKCRVSQPGGTTNHSIVRTIGTGISRGAGGTTALFGQNYNGAHRLAGDEGEILTWNRSLSDGELDELMGYFNATYNKGLT